MDPITHRFMMAAAISSIKSYWFSGLLKNAVGETAPTGKDSVIDSSKNAYVLGDYTSGGHNVASLLKYNKFGELQIQKRISTGGSGIALKGFSFGGNALYCGFFNQSGFNPSGEKRNLVIKLDTLGNITWQRHLAQYINPDTSPPDNFYYKLLSVNSDNHDLSTDSSGASVYISGDAYTSYYRNQDGNQSIVNGLVSKVSSSGSVLWSRLLGPDLTTNPSPSGSGFTKDFIGSFYRNVVDSSGNVISFGRAFPSGGSGSLYPWIVKHNSSGTLLWSKIINNVVGFGFGPTVQDMETDSSGNIYCVMRGSGGGIYNSLYVIKIDSSGNLSWSRKLYNSSNNNDSPSNPLVSVDSSGNVYAGIFLSGGYHLIKYNSSGTLQYQRKIILSGHAINSIKIDNSNNILLVGSSIKTLQSQSQNKTTIIKLKSDGTILGTYQNLTISEGQLSPETTYLSPTLSSLNIDNITVPIPFSSLNDYKSENTNFVSDQIVYLNETSVPVPEEPAEFDIEIWGGKGTDVTIFPRNGDYPGNNNAVADDSPDRKGGLGGYTKLTMIIPPNYTIQIRPSYYAGGNWGGGVAAGFGINGQWLAVVGGGGGAGYSSLYSFNPNNRGLQFMGASAGGNGSGGYGSGDPANGENGSACDGSNPDRDQLYGSRLTAGGGAGAPGGLADGEVSSCPRDWWSPGGSGKGGSGGGGNIRIYKDQSILDGYLSIFPDIKMTYVTHSNSVSTGAKVKITNKKAGGGFIEYTSNIDIEASDINRI